MDGENRRKGQFVIPKEARELFGFQPGETILVLCDAERGIAIPPKAVMDKHMNRIFGEVMGEESNE